jgi:hypothetical protein
LGCFGKSLLSRHSFQGLDDSFNFIGLIPSRKVYILLPKIDIKKISRPHPRMRELFLEPTNNREIYIYLSF